jgi:hypothetical protein
VTGWCKAFRIGDGEHLKTRLNVIKKWHGVTPDYAMTGWCKAFRIGDEAVLKMCTKFGNFRFVCLRLYSCMFQPAGVRKPWDLCRYVNTTVGFTSLK